MQEKPLLGSSLRQADIINWEDDSILHITFSENNRFSRECVEDAGHIEYILKTISQLWGIKCELKIDKLAKEMEKISKRDDIIDDVIEIFNGTLIEEKGINNKEIN